MVEFSSVNSGGEIFFNESLETLARDLPQCKPHIFFGPPRVWEQLRQSITAKFGGADALKAAQAVHRRDSVQAATCVRAEGRFAPRASAD